MAVAWLRTLKHQRKWMQLQLETGFDGHFLDNRMLSKESKTFLFQKAITQKTIFYTRKADFILLNSPE